MKKLSVILLGIMVCGYNLYAGSGHIIPPIIVNATITNSTYYGNGVGLTNMAASNVSAGTTPTNYTATSSDVQGNLVGIDAALGNKQDRIYSSASDFTYTVNAGTITITGYIGAGGTVNIPPMIAGLPVVEIGYEAFIFNYNLTSLILPSSITNLAYASFEWCTNLTSAIIPNGYIGEEAFDLCANLTNVTIGSGVNNLGPGLFANCPKMVGIYFYGNAPNLVGIDQFAVDTTTIFYLSGMSGFGTNFGGMTTAIWGPVVAANVVQNGVTNTPNTQGNITLPNDTTKVSTNGSGSGLTGITAAQVGALSNNQTGVTLSGSFSGNGTSLTGVTATVTYGTASTNAYRGNWGNVVSGQVAILNTNTAPLQSYLSTSNTAAAALPASSTNSLAVTALQITGLSGNGVVPVGAVQMYGAAATPAGWLLCDGSAISTNTYSALFAVIGTNYGGATTNMNLPDFRGVFPKGAGTTTRTAGKDAMTNAYAAVLGTYYQDKLQGHYHQAAFNKELRNATVATANALMETADAIHFNSNVTGSGPLLPDGANGTPRTGTSTEPQSLGITFIIKY